MRWNRFKKLLGLLAVASVMALADVATFAQVSLSAQEIPVTGDAAKFLLPAMGVLLAVSAVLLIVYLVLSKKKK